MTDDLNKQWAELEGWNPKGERFIEQNSKIYGYAPRLGKWPLPNWTEPNRFFAEVVPRMRKLKFTFLLSDVEEDCQFEFFYLNKRISWNNRITHREVGIAGLTAAIQARKELGK